MSETKFYTDTVNGISIRLEHCDLSDLQWPGFVGNVRIYTIAGTFEYVWTCYTEETEPLTFPWVNYHNRFESVQQPYQDQIRKAIIKYCRDRVYTAMGI